MTGSAYFPDGEEDRIDAEEERRLPTDYAALETETEADPRARVIDLSTTEGIVEHFMDLPDDNLENIAKRSAFDAESATHVIVATSILAVRRANRPKPARSSDLEFMGLRLHKINEPPVTQGRPAGYEPPLADEVE